MMSKKYLVLLVLGLVFSGLTTSASGVEWSGTYRFEFNQFDTLELDGENRGKDYSTHHLVLRPKIVAADGLNIYGRFDIFNNAEATAGMNNQIGQVLGGGVTGDTNFDNTDATTDRQDADSILVNELYLTLNNEFGQFIVGRAPLHFGLGMTFNAGRGEFDHFFDQRDLVAYKMVFGNIYIMPSMAKLVEGRKNAGAEDANEYNIHVQYDNPGANVEIGLFYQMRRVNSNALALPSSGAIGGAGAVVGEDATFNQLGVYLDRNSDNWRFAIEGAFRDGRSGYKTAADQTVKYKGLGVAVEFEHRPQGAKYVWGIRAGQASGDDIGTDTTYDGFAFDRNYDVALLMFNQQLGNADFLQTSIIGGGGQGGTNGNEGYDVEAISNVTYIAPYWVYKWKENWDVRVSFITGTLDQELGDSDKDLGYEFDLALDYRSNNFLWVNELGFFSPGKAFEGGSSDFDTKSAFGFVSKIAITF